MQNFEALIPYRNEFHFEIQADGDINLLDTPGRENLLHWKLRTTYQVIQGLYFNFSVFIYTQKLCILHKYLTVVQANSK